MKNSNHATEAQHPVPEQKVQELMEEAKKNFTPDDLKKYFVQEETVPLEDVIREMKEYQNQATQGGHE